VQIHKTARLFASAGLLSLAACSGGGGGSGGSIVNGPVVTPPIGSVNITGVTALGTGGNAPLEATGPTPNFATNANLPPNGTIFPLTQGAILITSISASGVDAGAGTATIQNNLISGNNAIPIIDLKIPNLGINAAGLRGDGTLQTQIDGSTVGVIVTSLTYTLLGSWSYKPGGNKGTDLGLAVSGYQTPAGSVPTSGTASYAGIGGQNSGTAAGGVIGSVVVPAGSSSINAATLSGDVNLSVNFGTQQVNGTMTNMVAKDVTTGATSPWNNVTLTGSLSQSAGNTSRGAVITGTTQAQTAPSGATFGMANGATGNLSGALYGPNANEAGAVWSVNQGSGATGKTAFGIFGATKQ
jgi:hypothetical protein